MTDKEQSDAEPVAWRWKWPDSGLWFATENKLYADHVKDHGVAIEPLFAAPPRPDAQPDAEPVRPAWVEPIGNWTGEYRICIETSEQVCTFDVGSAFC
jgi:hypothetical protein